MRENETNLIKQKYQEIKNNIWDIESLLNILTAALDNEFNPPKRIELLNYTNIIANYIKTQNKLTDEFLDKLNLPEKQAKITILKPSSFKFDD